MPSQNPTPDEIKEQLSDTVSDFDEEEFDKKLSEYEERYGTWGDQNFIAWAVAHKEYGVRIEADFDIPEQQRQGQAPEVREYTVEDIRNGEVLDNRDEDGPENFILKGYVLDMWEDISSNNNQQRKITLRDKTGAMTCMASGDDAVAQFEASGISVGDFVNLSGAQVYSFVPEDSDDPVYKVSLSQYTDYLTPDDPDFPMSDVGKDYFQEPTYEGDFVVVEGVISSHDSLTYEGCANCRRSYDDDEYQTCPNCQETDDTSEYRIDTVRITYGSSTVTTTWYPGQNLDLDMDDPTLVAVRILGRHTKSEGNDGGEYDDIVVDYWEVVDEGVGPKQESVDETVDEDEDEPEEESEEAESEPEEVEATGNGEVTGDDLQKMADVVESQVDEFSFEIPLTNPSDRLSREFGVDDHDVHREVFRVVLSRDNDISIKGDIEVEPDEWSEQYLA